MSADPHVRARLAALNERQRAWLAQRLRLGATAVGTARLVAFYAPAGSVSDADLRRHLQAQLPDHMIPALLVALEQLPRTPNGKVDRQALSVVAMDGRRITDDGRTATGRAPSSVGGSSAAPAGAAATLAAIWAEVLGIDEIQPTDNFFELGGDSIMSIRVIARAKTAGLTLKPSDLFDHPTLEALALCTSQAETPRPPVPEDPRIGPAPLLPIQHWFFEQNLARPNHWNQGVRLVASGRLDPARTREAARRLADHHEALRARFARTDAGWTHEILPGSDEAPFSHLRLEAVEVDQALKALHGQLDIANGQVFHLAQLDLEGGPSHVVVIAHHLVVDAVSWVVLLEDVQTLLVALHRGLTPTLPAQTGSLIRWGQALQAHAVAPEREPEGAYWRRSGGDVTPLPVDAPGGANTVATAATHTLTLSVDETHTLLREIHGAYQTTVVDLLMTALAQVLTRWAVNPRVVVAVEGHGREAALADLDLSRTVGWLTSVYPLALTLDQNADTGRQILSIKEQMRAVPDRGVGYGLLRYLGPDALAAELRRQTDPPILFNYLGHLDQPTNGAALFSQITAADQGARHGENARRYLVDIDCAVRGGMFEATFTYSSAQYRAATIEALASHFGLALRALIDHCRSPEAGGRSASDFSLAGVDDDELTKIARLLGN